MSDLALGDDKVKTVFAGERIAQAGAEFSDEDWQNGLELDKSGRVKNTLHNLTIILENDPNLKGVVFNQLLDGWRSRAMCLGGTPRNSGEMRMMPSLPAMWIPTTAPFPPGTTTSP